MDDGAHAVTVARELGDGADVGDHLGPGRGIEARRAGGMAGGVVALIVAPVHHREIRGRETLARMALGPGQGGDQRADLVGPAQEALPVSGGNKVVEDRARHDREAALLERGRDARAVQRHVAVRTELQPGEPRLRGFVQHALPRRQVGVGHVVHAPAAGRAGHGDRMAHGTSLASRGVSG
jgi:hypothetical protein